MYSNIPHVSNSQDAIASIQAMRIQEQAAYQTEDYLSKHQENPQLHHSSNSSSSSPQQQQQQQQRPVDKECRSKMAEWCFQVVDFCKFNRETVSIAMNYLDRFLMTAPDAILNRKTFQLAAMTCLYTAIKVHEPEAMEPQVIASLSRGAYTEDEVTAMERRIVMAIQWRMNPPTAMAFVHHFMTFCGNGTPASNADILELAKFQTELAAANYNLICAVPASTIAFAALSNALQQCTVGDDDYYEFATRIAHIASIDADSDLVFQVQDDLYEAIQTSTMKCTSGRSMKNTSIRKDDMEDVSSNSSIHYSPRSVSAAAATATSN